MRNLPDITLVNNFTILTIKHVVFLSLWEADPGIVRRQFELLSVVELKHKNEILHTLFLPWFH